MGLFDVFKKKDCEICGKEVGLFGYKKLEDGEICNACVKRLSPWFDDRRHSTVEQIKAQLAYRERNRQELNGFRPAKTYGEHYALKAELVNGVPSRFVVAQTDSYLEENADLINFKDVTSFNIDVREADRELKRRNSEGEYVSYVPPRYEYSYDFYAEIHVNHPYFDEIRFRLNSSTLNLETIERRVGFGGSMFRGGFDPSLYPEYRQYRSVCDELEQLFQAGMQGMALTGQMPPMGYAPAAAPMGYAPAAPAAAPMGYAPAAPAGYAPAAPAAAPAAAPVGYAPAAPAPAPEAPAVPKFCPNCGAPTEGAKFCQSCGSRL